MKKWEILHTGKIADLVTILLENRGIKTAQEREAFLHPNLGDVTPKAVGIDAKQLKKALARITTAIEKKEQIVVFGDYDVDGITGSAILWESLHGLGAKVLPYIPHRVDEGYGLSKIGIENVMQQIENVALIITVDNGIVANDAVTFANTKNIDVIITDHHVPPSGEFEKVPDAHAIVHTTKLCGASVAWLLAKELGVNEDRHLELATLGTVADLVPLTGANRAIVKAGLEKVADTRRPGLQELYKNAGLQKEVFSPYEIGYVIGPRLNAAGRVESAMESLRLLCTTKRDRAIELAAKLELVNKERQQLLKEAKEHAIAGVRTQGEAIKKLLVVSDARYAQGIIGLVAGKLVEEFYRPAIVLSLGETTSKASARSVSGFNIIEFLRLHTSHLINVGGHPMAAGFTIETKKIAAFQKALETKAEEFLTAEILTRTLKIDCELPFSLITQKLYQSLQQLGPFGMNNPEPVFATKGVTIADLRIMGKDKTHLRLQLRQDDAVFEAVGFGMAELASNMHSGDTIDVAYTIDENVWNGNVKLQLMIKDIIVK